MIIKGDSPDHEPGCDIEAIEEAKEHWKALMKQGPHLVTIQMANIAAFGKKFIYITFLNENSEPERLGRYKDFS